MAVRVLWVGAWMGAGCSRSRGICCGGRGRPAGSLGRVGGRQEREGAAKGKNWRKCLFTPRSVPEEGQGTAQADTHGRIPRGTHSFPPPPPIPRAPGSQPEGDASPKLGPREAATAGAGGFPSGWLSFSPTRFLGQLMRTSPGPPESQYGGLPPSKAQSNHPARVSMASGDTSVPCQAGQQPGQGHQSLLWSEL